MVDAATLYRDLTARGVQFEVAGDRLRAVAPKGTFTPEINAAVGEAKPAILALLRDRETAISWRYDQMAVRCPSSGPIPFLVARDNLADDQPGACLSCGDPMEPGRRYRCGSCVSAAERVLCERYES